MNIVDASKEGLNNKIKLSEKQQQVADFKEGSLLVQASAGSGKTRVLTERIKRLVNVSKRKILAITFTNKACEEIEERLKDDIDVNQYLFIGTFHRFCIHVLENHGDAIGYGELPQIFSETDDRLKIIETAILLTPSIKSAYERKDIKERNKFKYEALEFIAKIKREVILDEELASEVSDEKIILLYYKYREIMDSQNAIDFDDLLLITYKLFIYNPKIAALYRRNYEYICVDEAQDMNKAQYMLLKALTGDEHKNVMLVGDPKQAIYGFNGSKSTYMMSYFNNDYSPTIIELTENYRNSKKVLEIANKIMPNSTCVDNAAIEGICDIRSFKNVEEEVSWVVSKIKELITTSIYEDIEGNVDCDKIAILARNKYVLIPFEKELKNNDITSYYKNTSSGVAFESDYINLFNLALQVKINPKDSLHRSQVQRIIGLNGLKSLEEIIANTSNPIYVDVLKTVLNLKDDGENMKKEVQSLMDKTNSITCSGKFADNDKLMMLNDLNELLLHWKNYTRSTTNKSLSSFRNAMALGQTNQSIESHGVALSTVHTMKGQEKDIIFIVGMDNETFPDYRAIKEGGIEIQQEKNNFYVAVTRAKRYLYITYPLTRTMPWGGTKSRIKSDFLKNIVK